MGLPFPSKANDLEEIGELMEVSKCAVTERTRNMSIIISPTVKENKYRGRMGEGGKKERLLVAISNATTSSPSRL